jgi:hypothetical protein
MPINGIVGMLNQIRTFFIDEMVGCHKVLPIYCLGISTTKKGNTSVVLPSLNLFYYGGLTAAGTRCPAARTTGVEVNAGVDFKSISHKID